MERYNTLLKGFKKAETVITYFVLMSFLISVGYHFHLTSTEEENANDCKNLHSQNYNSKHNELFYQKIDGKCCGFILEENKIVKGCYE